MRHAHFGYLWSHQPLSRRPREPRCNCAPQWHLVQPLLQCKGHNSRLPLFHDAMHEKYLTISSFPDRANKIKKRGAGAAAPAGVRGVPEIIFSFLTAVGGAQQTRTKSK